LSGLGAIPRTTQDNHKVFFKRGAWRLGSVILNRKGTFDMMPPMDTRLLNRPQIRPEATAMTKPQGGKATWLKGPLYALKRLTKFPATLFQANAKSPSV
jgi:hypothetical protein